MFSPSRLALARKRQGLTLTALSGSSGLSVRILSDYENGHRDPSPEALSALVKYLKVSPSFFDLPTLSEPPVDALSFRALSKMTSRQRDRSIAWATVGAELNRWISEHYNTPINDVPTLEALSDQRASTISAQSVAEIVRARWGLGEAPLGNVVHLLESHGIHVYSLSNYAAEVDAFSFYSEDGQPIIFLNTVKSGERGRFDACHELGHLVLHCGPNVVRGPEAEREADRFASAFLMPEADVRASAPLNPSLSQILDLKQRWRVAAMALTHRLHGLGLLSDWLYRTTCINLSRMGYRSQEPGGIERESSQLLSKVFADLRGDRERLQDLVEQMGLDLGQISPIIFGLAPTLLEGGGETSAPERPLLRVMASEGRWGQESGPRPAAPSPTRRPNGPGRATGRGRRPRTN